MAFDSLDLLSVMMSFWPIFAYGQRREILVIGGNGASINGLNSVEVYDSVTNSFTTGTPMSVPRLFPTTTLLPNGRVLIAGGWNGTNSLESTELYTP